ncbi:hypothetical protein D3C81_2058110 [compost metagenome]
MRGDLLEVVLQIDADHLVARDHDVVDRDPVQLEDAGQHGLAAAGLAGCGLVHGVAQFFVIGQLGGGGRQRAQQLPEPAQQAGQEPGMVVAHGVCPQICRMNSRTSLLPK